MKLPWMRQLDSCGFADLSRMDPNTSAGCPATQRSTPQDAKVYSQIFPTGMVAHDSGAITGSDGARTSSRHKWARLHPTGCTAITLRALAAGMATFTAGATGEIWDESCHCWYWSGAGDNWPVSILIAESMWRIFLPLTRHD
jgi:hypothetical protein